MNWKASSPGIETAAIAIAALCLGSAVGFAVMRIAPFGAGLPEAGVVGLLAIIAGWVLIERVDRRRGSQLLVSVSDVIEEDVLLLDQYLEDEALLLDGPLPVLRDDMRVVRLFAAQPTMTKAVMPLVGPGEMVARIEGFLGQPRGGPTAVDPVRQCGRTAAEDANAALHLALADIRRSLRQA